MSSQSTNSIHLSTDDYQCHIITNDSVPSGCQRNKKAEKVAKNEKTKKVPSLHVDGTENYHHLWVRAKLTGILYIVKLMADILY